MTPAPVAMIAADTVQIVSRIEADAAPLTQERAALARFGTERERLEGRPPRIARHPGLTAARRAFAARVRSEQRALPRPDR